MKDTEVRDDFITVKYDIKAGYHDFLWQYSKLSTGTNKNSQIIIKSIEFDGVEHTSFECKPCINSSSEQGSSDCHVCKANEYYSKTDVIAYYYLINLLIYRLTVSTAQVILILMQTH